MPRTTRSAIERVIASAFFGFLAVGCAATLIGLATAWRRYDADLLRSTDEVAGLITRIYEYRRANAQYPHSLAELGPITGNVVSKHQRDSTGNDECFCAAWCWRYLYRGGASPPALYRSLSHGNLSYEFASSSDYCFPKNIDEGWVASNEGSRRYLRSHFTNSSNGVKRDRRE